jgi:hypothetical protein
MAAAARRTPIGLSPKIKETEVTGYWIASISPLEKSLGKSYKESSFQPKPSLFSFKANVDRYSALFKLRVRPVDSSRALEAIPHRLELIASERIRLLALKAAKKVHSNEIESRLFVLNEQMDSIAPPVSKHTSSRLNEIHERIRDTDSFLEKLDSFLSA